MTVALLKSGAACERHRFERSSEQELVSRQEIRDVDDPVETHGLCHGSACDEVSLASIGTAQIAAP
ncbi:hypothetical protein CEP88_02390 [Roseobacter denitrificans]|nr:hypothetical protein [Roseobacter denitrificans]AVL51575.1 hypothetical protein CEP88_02390 [Roseobacter denitrificans]